MIDFGYLDYCLEKAGWCIQFSSEPYISCLTWLRVVLTRLQVERIN